MRPFIFEFVEEKVQLMLLKLIFVFFLKKHFWQNKIKRFCTFYSFTFAIEEKVMFAFYNKKINHRKQQVDEVK